MGLEDSFKETLRRHCQDEVLIGALWQEVILRHSTKRRHYHSLEHLEYIHQGLQRAGTVIDDPDALVLATAYHDIIQTITRGDDEKRSAEFMIGQLEPAGIPETTLRRAAAHIVATHDHQPSAVPDTNLFTDADLSILGSSPEEYAEYARKIRMEYTGIPAPLYNAGRRKVLKKLLDLPSIFKTNSFNHFEQQARHNLRWELTVL